MDDYKKLMNELSEPKIMQRVLIGYDPETNMPVAQAALTDFDYELFLNYADTKGFDKGILECLTLEVDIKKMMLAGIQIAEPLQSLKCVVKSTIKS